MTYIPRQTAIAIQEEARARQLEAELETLRIREARRKEKMSTGDVVAMVALSALVGMYLFGGSRRS